MRRSRIRTLILFVPVIGGFALLAAACSSRSQEQQLLQNYFRASRIRDNTTLANIAAVAFDPRTDGTVENFDITDVGKESRRQLQIKQLTKDEEDARKADADFAKKKKEYQDQNIEAIERVVKAERARQTVKGKDAEVQAAWTKWRDEQAQYQRKLADARTRLANERAMAVSSLTPPGRGDVDVSNMDVEMLTKQVTINAQVRMPNGPTAPRTMVVTLQKAIGKASDGQTREGRWMITGIRPEGGGAPTS
jgi:hypothetical protein